MHLHRCSFRAVGPFRDEQTIDFDALGAGGLFLLEGPTGSGKSTVIDAVVFALYGAVAADGADPARMASDHGRGDRTEPFVELEFSTGHGRFRIRRTPRHERAKRRGTGTTVVDPTVVLCRLVGEDSTPEPITTSLQEAGAEVPRIVGLSRAQFVQTVVLPQGQFATFLHAGADDRRAVLQTIFGTELYQQLQQELARRRAAARAHRDAADAAVRSALALLGGAAGLDDAAQSELDAVADADAALDDVVTALGLRLADEEKRAVDDHRIAEERRARDDAAHREATRLADLRARLLDLGRRRDDLARGAADVDRARQRLALGERAARAADAVDAAALARAEHVAATAALDVAVTAARRLVPDLDLADVAGQEQQRRLAAARLGDAQADEAALPAAVAELGAARRGADEAGARVASLRSERASLPDRLAAAQQSAGRAVAGAARLDAVSAVVDAARARHGAALTLPRRLTDVTSARAGVAAAHADAAAANHAHAALMQSRLDGMAGALAGELVAGRPCPVCGSCEHPAPAPPGDDPVTDAHVAAAADRRDAAAERLAAAGSALRDAESALSAAAAAAGIASAELLSLAAEVGTVIDRRAVELEQAAAERDAAVQCRDALPGLEAEVESIAARLEDVDAALATAEIARAAAAALVDEREASLAGRRAAIAVAADGFPTVSARVAHLVEVADALGVAAAATTRLGVAAGARSTADRACAVALRREGFDDAAEVTRAALATDEHDRLRSLVVAAEAEAAAVSAGLAEPALAGVDLATPVDVAGAAARLAAAEVETDRAFTDRRVREARRHSAAGRAEEVRSAVADRAAVRDDTAAVIRVADLVNAANPLRTELAAFVLRRRFAEVVTAANRRLADMSGGRYELSADDARSGARRAGLGLAVLDRVTGRARKPTTLSGGETFYCSLALALGLADVVRQEAGGVDLGTLFVDEGFGSLDPQTLEAVLEVLGGLRRAGRTVGVVSHVAELRDLIPDRLEVRRGVDGSSSAVVRAAAAD